MNNKQEFKDLYLNNKIRYRYNPKDAFSNSTACYAHLTHKSTKYYETIVHNHKEICVKDFKKYLKKIKLIFKGLKIKKKYGTYSIIIPDYLLAKNRNINENKRLLAALTMIRFLWESHGDLYSISFIEEFANDNSKKNTMTKFCNAFNNNIRGFASGHGLGNGNDRKILVQTSNQFLKKRLDKCTKYFQVEQPRFKSINH